MVAEMTSLPNKIFIAAAGLALLLASPAEAAKTRKHKKPILSPTAVTAAPSRTPARFKDTTAFPSGPVMFGNDYLGDDPDPFIRLQLLRDLGARYGGEP
jgi:hypothetical protein